MSSNKMHLSDDACSKIMWTPSSKNDTNMDDFRCHVNKTYGFKIG